MKVDYLKKEQIETATLELIQAYGKKYGEVSIPVPVEEMLECHLGLGLEYGDLKEATGFGDVLGATWIKDRRVVIDTSLDPTEYPDQEGRCRFTLAHEVGHWQLHRIYFEIDPLQRTIFDTKDSRPSIVCRRSSSKEPIEWQADVFASYLLMPTHLIEAAWREEHGSSVAYQAAAEITALAQRFGDERTTTGIARRMAARFKTSGQAMQIRLKDLQLINASASAPTIFDA